MKILAFLILFTASGFAQTVSDVSDLSAIKVITPDSGIVNAGSIKDVLANYPGLAASVRTALVAKLQSEDELTAKARLTKLQAIGVTIPAGAVTAVNNRVETLRVAKEAALITVAKTNPQRASAKMQELIAKGCPIYQSTITAVNAKLPAASPTPTPTPEPNDGL